jgi:hypothetical protein
MNTHTIRRTPWTCRFGRAGVTIEQLGPETSRVDEVFWACRQPARVPALRLITRRECEDCPFWEASPRLERER